MKRVLTFLLAITSTIFVIATPKPHTYYEITKVKEFHGIRASKELINSICLNRVIYFGTKLYDYSFRQFAPGSGVTSMGKPATFFDMYDKNKLIIPNKVYYSVSILATSWGKDNLNWFPYRGSSDFFSPKFSQMVCETNINGKRGEITFRTDDNQYITLSVSECSDSSHKQLLDLKGVWDNYYPFTHKLFSVDGIIEYQRPTLQGPWEKVKEQVIIDLIVSNKNQYYILGFKCIQQDRSTGISLSRRDAGFSEAKAVKRSKQSVTCLPAKGDRVGFANARSVSLSFDLSGYDFMSVMGDYHAYPYIYSHEIIIGK